MIPTELPTLSFLEDEGFQLNLKSRGGVSLLTWAASWLHSRGALIVKAVATQSAFKDSLNHKYTGTVSG